MCIVFLAHRVHPSYPLVVASNRDECLDRPTEPVAVRRSDEDNEQGRAGSDGGGGDRSNRPPQRHSTGGNRRRGRARASLAGRDLVGGGTWLGVALPARDEDENDDGDDDGDETEDDRAEGSMRGGRDETSAPLKWIAVTNFREAGRRSTSRPSRGGLLREYLDADRSARAFVSDLRPRGREFNGFNLLVGDGSGIYYYGNRAKDDARSKEPRPLSRGIYGLSNGLLDSPWPKVERGKEMLRTLCRRDARGRSPSIESFHEQLMDMLSDRTQANDDEQLPRTGLDPASERYVSSIFLPDGLLHGRPYGTLSSTTIVVDADGKASVLERTWRSGSDRWFRFDSKGGADVTCRMTCSSRMLHEDNAGDLP